MKNNLVPYFCSLDWSNSRLPSGIEHTKLEMSISNRGRCILLEQFMELSWYVIFGAIPPLKAILSPEST